MKNMIKRIFLIVVCMVMLALPAIVYAADTGETSGTQSEVQVSGARQGWYVLKNGKKRYFVDGKYLRGLQKIGKNYYYFSDKGYMQTGTVTVKKVTYYLNEKGVLQGKKVKSKYYYPSGKVMNSYDAENMLALQNAREVLNRITTPDMSKSAKLKKCFDWVISKPYKTLRPFTNAKGWPAVYANDHFVRGGGNCMSDGAAFAYLAKAIGYKDVNVCTDSKGSHAHGWAEVNGLVYDPLFAEAKNYWNNYGVRYGVYKLSAIVRIKI